MKKTLLAVFSVSITAGVICLTYAQAKEFYISRILKLLKQKKGSELSEEETKQFKEEADKLWLWEIRLVHKYVTRRSQGASDAELTQLKERMDKKKILEKINLKIIENP